MDKELLEQRKQSLMDVIDNPQYRPMKLKEMAVLLGVPKEGKNELKEVLDALLAEGKIGISSKNRYGKPDSNVVVGILDVNSRGFGFVKLDNGSEDIFVPEDYMNGAINGDRVLVRVEESLYKSEGKRNVGLITRILEHTLTEVVGTYHKKKKFGFVVPDNKKITKSIIIKAENDRQAVTGNKVVAKITNYGNFFDSPQGVITEILGKVNEPGVDILSIAKAFNLPIDYPEEVLACVENIKDSVDSADMAGRLDIRSWQTVTIDGEDAKDLDDAITLSKEGDNYKLGVHIADVTNYVTENSPLDKEALRRGTSVYLVDRVIPMLPKKLSNGICSLNEQTDRLALSCIMTVDKKGTVIDHMIAETIINVDHRMTYTSVQKILEELGLEPKQKSKDEVAEDTVAQTFVEDITGQQSGQSKKKLEKELKSELEAEKYADVVPMFILMRELSVVIRAARGKRGAMDFDFPESKIILDENGKPIDIKPYERNTATKIIEDFMLLANETIAEDYFWQEIPFVYRVHENPDEEKIRKFATFINNFGLSLRITENGVHPKEFQKILDKIEGHEEEPLISRIMLRSMKQARYSTECSGHFGLSARYYCHFTSPIRRYPDLQIHRIIKENIRSGITQRRMEHYNAILDDVTVQSSRTERRAQETEREVIKLKKVQYMKRFVGKQFEGVISGVTNYGIYVELPNTVEGLVHINTMYDDYYEYIENSYMLVGEYTGKKYKIGQKVKVKVDYVDEELRTIDFSLNNVNKRKNYRNYYGYEYDSYDYDDEDEDYLFDSE